MLFGELKYNGSNCRFQLNEFELSIHSMDVPVGAMPLALITTELPPVNEVLLGTCYPDGKAIAIYVNGYWNSSNNVLFQKVRWYIKFSRRQSKLSALKISADELNEIFPVSRAIHGWSTEESTAEYSLKIKPFNSEAYEFQHEGRQVTCQYVMHWGISQRNTSAPVHIGTQFVMRFEATDDYLFCSSLIGIGKHYFEYLCYRQNISINSIVALTQSESGRYIECGEFSAPWILTAEKEDEKVIRKKYIPEYLIEQGNTLLLQSISDGIIYLRHIPKSTADNRVLTPARFVMVTAAFEWECHRTKNPRKKCAKIRANWQ